MKNDRLFSHDVPIENGGDILRAKVNSAAWRDDFELELIPARYEGEGLYKVMALPLITYGVNRHDIVEVSSNGFIVGVVSASKHTGFRVLLYDHSLYEQIIKSLVSVGADIEYNSHSFFGVDTESPKIAAKVEDILSNLQDGKKISFETTASS